MSRAKSKQNVETCGDCGALEVSWASVNKGILLCTQCCSIHRSYGKHISVVKHVTKSFWPGNQLNMVCTLNNNGANNIWEHTLLENGGKLLKKKPTAKDPLNVKQEYIKNKHLKCLYAFRENYEDGLLSVENELGKQLHASVRTANLETSFRLLALGADPNYFHDEKGSTSLHVAVKSDQKLQLELLLVHGADPTYPDKVGKTPLDYARNFGNKEILSRLIESQYEVTDTFSYYLSLKKPDHSTGIHVLIPPKGFKSNPESLAKLQMLPNHVFEELVMDVYDEVDRRESEATWLSCADTLELNTVPFLPVDNTLSTTRNQGRQKLARFSTPELKGLVYDILVETQRRQILSHKGSISLRDTSRIIEEDPLYDSVASDDDYAVVPALDEENEDLEKHDMSNDSSKHSISSTKSLQFQTDNRQLAPPLDLKPPIKSPTIKQDVVSIEMIMRTNQMLEELTKQLKVSDSTITELKNEVRMLRQSVTRLQVENFELKSRLSHRFGRLNGDNGFDSLENISEHHLIDHKSGIPNGMDEVDVRLQKKVQRPSSMYEPREGMLKVPNWQALKNQLKQNQELPKTTSQSLYAPEDRELVLQCTEQITRTIQALCRAIQEPESDECVMCAEKVQQAIVRLASTLHKDSDQERIKLMVEVANRLHPECHNLQMSRRRGDSVVADQHFTNIRDLALHLAKFTKDIVTKYSSNP